MSLPSRERGLKLLGQKNMLLRFASLPSRERGLKLNTGTPTRKCLDVAPFAGAWIET